MKRSGSRGGLAVGSAICLAVGLALGLAMGCGDDALPGTGTDASTSSTNGSTGTRGSSSTGALFTSTTTSTSSTSSSTDPTQATASQSDSSPPTTGGSACSAPQTTGAAETGDMGFAFLETDYCDYVQVDRVAVPLVTTLLVADPDAYNLASPADDRGFAFLAGINQAVMMLHDLLDADLVDRGYVPCDACSLQVTSLLVPDVLTLSLDAPTTFPNGRRPDDPVFDRMLAMLLLDLDVHELSTFEQVPLNPPQNDQTFSTAWPYLIPVVD